jgi:hypothetical protein
VVTGGAAACGSRACRRRSRRGASGVYGSGERRSVPSRLSIAPSYGVKGWGPKFDQIGRIGLNQVALTDWAAPVIVTVQMPFKTLSQPVQVLTLLR